MTYYTVIGRRQFLRNVGIGAMLLRAPPIVHALAAQNVSNEFISLDDKIEKCNQESRSRGVGAVCSGEYFSRDSSSQAFYDRAKGRVTLKTDTKTALGKRGYFKLIDTNKDGIPDLYVVPGAFGGEQERRIDNVLGYSPQYLRNLFQTGMREIVDYKIKLLKVFGTIPTYIPDPKKP
ncbi:hypothetical protein HYY71_06235 [Candidatus Woesearchaeota archaeon]|nr:hypothetical protein [Candidatus Woesearchaeota archaeon]